MRASLWLAPTIAMMACTTTQPSPSTPPAERWARPEAVVTEAQAKQNTYQSHRAPELSIDEESRRYLLSYGREVCDGDVSAAQALAKPATFANPEAPVIAILFDKNGGRKAHHRADSKGASLTAQVETAASEVCKEAASGDQLHLMVVTYTARLPNFGEKGIFEYKVFEPQVNGLAVERNGKRVEYDPALQSEANHGPKNLRSAINEQLGSKIDLFDNANDIILEVYKVAHFGERVSDGTFADFHRGHTILKPEEVTKALVRERLDLIGAWYSHNVIGSEVVYEYSPSSGQYRDKDRTMVRSLMAVWILNRLGEFLDDAQLKAYGAETIDYYLKTYFQIEESKKQGRIVPWPASLPNGNTITNRYTAGSFLGAAILERADRDRWLQEDRLVMEWVMGFQRDDKIMWTQFAESQYFMPGHLMLSLAYHYDKLEDPTYLNWFQSIYDAYETPIYQLMDLGDERLHPLAPAWYTQPAAFMYHKTGDNRYRDFVYAINDRVERLHAHNRNGMVYYDYDGILTPKLGYYGNTSVTAAALESLADAAIVARKDGDMERYRRYTTVVRHATAYLLRIQFTPDNTYYVKHRERVIGGFKSDMINSVVWMDNVWHFTSALIKIHDNDLLADAPTLPWPPTTP